MSLRAGMTGGAMAQRLIERDICDVILQDDPQAFHAGTRDQVDAIVEAAEGHGWELLFADRHPHAGGPDHYAAYLQDGQGFEVELVAT